MLLMGMRKPPMNKPLLLTYLNKKEPQKNNTLRVVYS